MMNIKNMKLLTILLLSLSLTHAEDEVITSSQEQESEVFEKIEVEGGGDSIFDVPNYFERPNYLKNAPAQQRMTVKEAMNIPGVMSDPLKALQTLAGVSSPASFSGELVIHGSKAYETFYTYNYMPLGYTFHLGGIHSVISPDAIEQLDVYLGAFDVTYGNAMGGVVDITPKFPTGTNSGHLHIGLFDSSAAIDAKIADNLSLYVGGRRSYYDLILDVVSPEIPGFTIDTYPNYYDLTTILAYTPNDENIITFEVIAAKDTTEVTRETASVCNPDFVGDATTLQSYRTYGLRWKYDNYDTTKSNTVLAYTVRKDKTDVFGQIQSEENFQDLKFNNTTTLDFDLHKVALGFDIVNYNHPYDYKLPPTFLADDEYAGQSETVEYSGEQNFTNYALFLQDIYSLTEGLKVRYGLRGNYTEFQTFGYNLDPRTALIYEFGNQSVALATGQYSQYPVLSRTIEEFSDEDLQYEKSFHLSLNYKYNFSDKHSIEVEPFHKEYTSLSMSDGNGKYVSLTKELNGLMSEDGLGYAQGIDFTYKYRNDELYIFSTYSYLNAVRQYSEDGDLEEFLEEIPHTAQVAASYDLGGGWVTSALARYRTGILYDKPLESGVVNTNTADEPCYEATTTEQVRLPDFFTLNLKVTKTVKTSKRSSWEYSFELMNVTAYNNINGYSVDSETGEISESVDFLAFPFLPWFDVTYRF
jgi:hypothetical protein